MMNHHMPPGPGAGQHISPTLPMHPQQRRQDYHAYHQPPPQSPMHPHPYANYHHPPYYPAQPPYPPQRWQHPYHQPQHYMPPPQPQPPFPPRSPMVVTSQPHAHSMTPITRHPHMGGPPPQAVPSPLPIPQHVPQQPPPQAPPSPAPTPKKEIDFEEQKQEFAQEPTPPPASSRRQSQAQNPLSLPPEHRKPFYPSLPWYSIPDGRVAFPRRATASRRRRQDLRKPTDALALPTRAAPEEVPQEQAVEEAPSEASTMAAPSEPETPATSQAPSESDFTQVSTPATPAQAAMPSPKATPTQTPAQTHARRDTRTAIAVPNIPGLPKPRASPPAADKGDVPPAASTDSVTPTLGDEPPVEQPTEEQETPRTPPPRPAPKSWADLVRIKAPPGAASGTPNGAIITNGNALPKSAPLAEALKQYNVQSDTTLSFLEPRGLVNTGNMCYMNSILQILIFCSPFYSFLDQVRQRTVHSLKSDTPLIDAMIMFMREFKVLASAESTDALRKMLKPEQLEQYGEAVIPEYVYDAIRKLPRFQSMRRGHQQDAEEFLGFLLEGLHDECVAVMQGQASDKAQENGVGSPSETTSSTSQDGWLEVGKKQKASITRTAGQQDDPSPITKIFGGKLRSELRVPGLKDSVTLEPYKPLQLDIGAPHVNNIVDALKGLTRTEALTGDFGGRGNTAKKQVFIDQLPPVLILHLKRFQYESSLAGTQKIWKKVGYPLELEIPKDVFSPASRGGLAVKGGLPKYKLISVVYHHGKSAAGGHYTVDVLRQDGQEWIRTDDTIVRRIRPEDACGSEEDPKLLAKALEQHRADAELQQQRNMYQGLDEEEPEEDKPWSEVNGNPTAKKQWGGMANTTGTATPTSTTGKQTPTARKEGVKDGKVAYILLYARV